LFICCCNKSWRT